VSSPYFGQGHGVRHLATVRLTMLPSDGGSSRGRSPLRHPGRKERWKSKRETNWHHWACQWCQSLGFNLLAVWIYSRFLWLVQTKKGCLVPSSQCRHTSSANLMANSCCRCFSRRVQLLREESTGVELLIHGRPLGQDSPFGNIIIYQ